MFDPNLDPGVERAARQVMDAAYELETIGMRVERTEPAELVNERTPVTDGLMCQLAAAEFASAGLRQYAARVERGECEWCDIERLARPVPPEVAYLKSAPSFRWIWDALPPPDAPRIPKGEKSVGPSDWPDDFEYYPKGNSWRRSL
ncbi:hypothetical protein [Nocardia yamanashiensis]|uniref:hypothetical protein n=1 Tax=Nocardia yamanashiensis TaxID=209247 RepID=UPI000B095274|nr:hypothetical protein [Nocardia yamanashiensis]